MKILILHSAGDKYGSGVILHQVMKLLLNEGHELHFITPMGGELVNDAAALGLKVSIMNLGVLRKKYLHMSGIMNRLWNMLSAFVKLRRYVRKHSIDLIYNNSSAILVGGLVAKSGGQKYVWHIHEMPIHKQYFKVQAFLVNQLADKMIAVSDAVKNHWMTYVREEKITRVYNGIEFRPSNQSIRQQFVTDDVKLIGAIGRIQPLKGHMFLIQCVELPLKRGLKVKLIIAGDCFPGYEKYLHDLEEYIQLHGLHEHVMLLGFRTDVPDILASLDVFVHSSIEPDSFPTVILEAMLSHVPVATTVTGGASEMILDGKTGVHIDHTDIGNAANKLRILIEDKSLQQQLAVNAIKHISQNFTPKQFEKGIIQVLDSLRDD